MPKSSDGQRFPTGDSATSRATAGAEVEGLVPSVITRLIHIYVSVHEPSEDAATIYYRYYHLK